MTTVAIVRRVYTGGNTTDAHGDPVVPSETIVAAPGALVAPATSTDLADPTRDGRRIEFDVYLPFALDVGPHDGVTLDGVAYEVDGQAAPWRADWSGWEAGRVVRVWRVVG